MTQFFSKICFRRSILWCFLCIFRVFFGRFYFVDSTPSDNKNKRSSTHSISQGNHFPTCTQLKTLPTTPHFTEQSSSNISAPSKKRQAPPPISQGSHLPTCPQLKTLPTTPHLTEQPSSHISAPRNKRYPPHTILQGSHLPTSPY